MRLLLTGGRQRTGLRDRDEWHQYDEARILELDTGSGSLRAVFSYRTPAPLCPPEEPSHVFKSASRDPEGRLGVVTQTEVLVMEPDGSRVLRHLSHPWFNDLHHMAWLDGRLHVVSTGLDSLLILDEEGRPEQVRHAQGSDTWQCFDPEVDYRRVATTKPHACHPNYVFSAGGQVWLTRLEQCDAVCLDEPSKRIRIQAGHPHDGFVSAGGVWFTSVTGHLVQADPEDGSVLQDIDLNAAATEDAPLGWCRGLHISDGVAFVGFSRIRHTKTRQHLSWLKHGFRLPDGHRTLPTRVAAVDLETGTVLSEWETESAGLNALFSILPVEP